MPLKFILNNFIQPPIRTFKKLEDEQIVYRKKKLKFEQLACSRLYIFRTCNSVHPKIRQEYLIFRVLYLPIVKTDCKISVTHSKVSSVELTLVLGSYQLRNINENQCATHAYRFVCLSVCPTNSVHLQGPRSRERVYPRLMSGECFGQIVNLGAQMGEMRPPILFSL